MPTVEFCIVCYNFQRRLIRQLSSIHQQNESPDIIINIAYLKNEGSPRTEDIVNYYSNLGMKFNCTEFISKDDVCKRGFARNEQIRISKGDWLYFSDCDLIYHPDHFKKLSQYLKPTGTILGDNKLKYTEVIHQLSDSLYISNCYDQYTSYNKIDKYSKIVAPGGIQIVEKKLIYEHNNGYYCHPDKAIPRDFTKPFARSRCDGIFRRKFKKTTHIDLPWQIHLGHISRDDITSNKRQK